MPSSVGSALLLTGIVFALSGFGTLACVAALLGLLFELMLFFGDAAG